MAHVDLTTFIFLLTYSLFFPVIFAPVKVIVLNCLLIFTGVSITLMTTIRQTSPKDYALEALYETVEIFRPLFDKMFSQYPELVTISRRLDEKLVSMGHSPLQIVSQSTERLIETDCRLKYYLLPDQGSMFTPRNPNINDTEIEVFAACELMILTGEVVECRTGLILVIPSQYYGELHPVITGTTLMNTRHGPGLRHTELTLKLKNENSTNLIIRKGDHIGNVSIKKNNSFAIEPAF